MHDDATRIITEHGDPAHFQPWRINVGCRRGPRPVRALRSAWAMWRVGRRQRGLAAFVTYGSLAGFALGWLQTLARPFVPPRTHVMFDLLLERRRTGPAGLFDRFKMVGFRRSGVRAVVWGQSDGDVFAAEYDLPRDRFRWHPYHTTLEGFDAEPGDDGFVFAGGNFGRDYATVIAALRDVDFPVVIATTDPRIAPLAAGLDHIEVKGVSPTEFRRLMARCTVLVEAHPVDFVRTAGHQTMLNAMSLGKPVVMADRRSADRYLQDGVEGRVVPRGDADGLAAAVRGLLADPELRARMGAAGRRRLADPIYRTPNHMQSIYNFALVLEHARLDRPGQPALIDAYGPATAGPARAEGGR